MRHPTLTGLVVAPEKDFHRARRRLQPAEVVALLLLARGVARPGADPQVIALLTHPAHQLDPAAVLVAVEPQVETPLQHVVHRGVFRLGEPAAGMMGERDAQVAVREPRGQLLDLPASAPPQLAALGATATRPGGVETGDAQLDPGDLANAGEEQASRIVQEVIVALALEKGTILAEPPENALPLRTAVPQKSDDVVVAPADQSVEPGGVAGIDLATIDVVIARHDEEAVLVDAADIAHAAEETLGLIELLGQALALSRAQMPEAGVAGKEDQIGRKPVGLAQAAEIGPEIRQHVASVPPGQRIAGMEIGEMKPGDRRRHDQQRVSINIRRRGARLCAPAAANRQPRVAAMQLAERKGRGRK